MSTEPLHGVLEDLTSTGEGNGLEVEPLRDQDRKYRTPFNPEEIDVITQTPTIDLLLTRLKEGELNLSPDFQRRANLWDDARKSSLVESILLRIPIPSLYVAEDSEGNYDVVDGLQRLCSIAHFVDVEALNKVCKSNLEPLQLKNLNSFREYQDVLYSNLPRPLQRRIRETELTLHVIRASTPLAVKFNIFSRINQGGLPASDQELRNAIYPGVWQEKIKEMASLESYLTVTDNKIKTERMEDRELILRFVALCSMRSDQLRDNQETLADFLNETVENRLCAWQEKEWMDVRFAFDRAMKAAMKVFGSRAFKKQKSPINRGLFEAQSVALARKTDNELEILARNSKQVINDFDHALKTDKNFLRATMSFTGMGEASNTRISAIERIFRQVISLDGI